MTFSLKFIRLHRRKLVRLHHVLHEFSFSVRQVAAKKQWLLNCQENTIYLSVDSICSNFNRKKKHTHIETFLVSIPKLIKQEIVSNTPLGASMKAYVNRQAMGMRFFSQTKRTIID